MAPLKTDQVMDGKLEASGFIPGWCMSHMMVSGANTKQLAAFHLELPYKALLKGLSMTCLTFICVPNQIGSHCESTFPFLDCMVPPLKHFLFFYQILNRHNETGQKAPATLKRIWVRSQHVEEEVALALAGYAARTPQRGCKC